MSHLFIYWKLFFLFIVLLTVDAFSFITGNYECERVFSSAQVPIIRLCGRQNGVLCAGECFHQYEIDIDVPPCRVDSGPSMLQTSVLCFLIVIVGFMWIDEDFEDDGVTPVDEKISTSGLSAFLWTM